VKYFAKSNPIYIPPLSLDKVVNINLRDKAPDIVEFLGDFGLSQEQVNEALLYMRDNEVEAPEAALWFLSNYEVIWTKWVSLDVADKVKKALSG